MDSQTSPGELLGGHLLFRHLWHHHQRYAVIEGFQSAIHPAMRDKDVRLLEYLKLRNMLIDQKIFGNRFQLCPLDLFANRLDHEPVRATESPEAVADEGELMMGAKDRTQRNVEQRMLTQFFQGKTRRRKARTNRMTNEGETVIKVLLQWLQSTRDEDNIERLNAIKQTGERQWGKLIGCAKIVKGLIYLQKSLRGWACSQRQELCDHRIELLVECVRRIKLNGRQVQQLRQHFARHRVVQNIISVVPGGVISDLGNHMIALFDCFVAHPNKGIITRIIAGIDHMCPSPCDNRCISSEDGPGCLDGWSELLGRIKDHRIATLDQLLHNGQRWIDMSMLGRYDTQKTGHATFLSSPLKQVKTTIALFLFGNACWLCRWKEGGEDAGFALRHLSSYCIST